MIGALRKIPAAPFHECALGGFLPNGILQIHWCFPPTTGGVESHVADLATAMAKRGCRVIVLTGERIPIRSDLYEIVSTDLLNLETIKTASLPGKEFLAQFSNLLVQIVSRYHIDTIHGHNLHHFHAAPALAIETARRQLGLRVFHTFHETWPDVLREYPVYQLWNGNYTGSRHVQEQCQAVLGFSPTLYPLGVDTSVFRSSTECFTSGLPPVILHPARLLPWKGVDVSIRTLRLLVDRGHQLTLVLTDTQRIADWNRELNGYRQRIIGLVNELQLSSYVQFERASYADMPSLYQRADIVVYPTIGEEPYGLVPIEAMSCARPIIASNSGGIPETVVDGITGYIVPKGDAGALANRLAELISNPQLARRLGAAGRCRATDNFNAERYVSILLECFALA
jgi:glycosyltransferase involved in cell wall biosynthesis